MKHLLLEDLMVMGESHLGQVYLGIIPYQSIRHLFRLVIMRLWIGHQSCLEWFF